MDQDDTDPRRRAARTTPERLQLLEEDTQHLAHSVGDITKRVGTFSPEQLAQIRTVVREEVSDVGLRLDDPDHVDASREDFRWLRRTRLMWDRATKTTGNAVLLAILAVVATIAGLGFWAWIKRGGQ